MRRAWLLLLLPLLAACDLAEDPFAPQLVVDAVLYANEPFPDIRLSQTVPLGSLPDLEGVAGASVAIDRLGEDGEPDLTIEYRPYAANPSLYFPRGASQFSVQPLRRYRLRVRVPDDLGLVPPGREVRAETLVPDTFRVVQAPPDTVAYQPFSAPPETRVTRSEYPGRQTIYLFSIIALEPEQYGLTPTYRDLIDDENVDRLIEGTSPLLNEASYDVEADGTITLRIPWLAIAFYGRNRFIVQALDDAVYDFLRSRDAQFGSTTLSPGEIPEVLSNVENGVGVFGSASRAAVEMVVLP